MAVIGVVSDTHLPRFGRRLSPALVQGLAAAGLQQILHAGDITEAFALDLLEEIAPVIAVAGNNDGSALLERLGDRRILEIEGRRIGLTHGHLGLGRTTPERARRLFGDDGVELVVFGHSHQALWVPPQQGSPALLNPGSPTDGRRQRTRSFAVLQITGETIDARIVRLDDGS